MSQVGETVRALQVVDLRDGGHVAGMAVVAGYEPTATIYSRPTQVGQPHRLARVGTADRSDRVDSFLGKNWRDVGENEFDESRLNASAFRVGH